MPRIDLSVPGLGLLLFLFSFQLKRPRETTGPNRHRTARSQVHARWDSAKAGKLQVPHLMGLRMVQTRCFVCVGRPSYGEVSCEGCGFGMWVFACMCWPT